MFKQIPHYPNYEVNESGFVRNVKTGHTMKWIDNGKGYKSVKLYNEHTPKGRLCLVHRLVLSTFDPQQDKDVNHIDGNKSNNHLSNLEWVSKSQNTQHAHKTGLFKNKLSIKDVIQIKWMCKNTNKSNGEIGHIFGVRHSTVWKIRNGYLYHYI